MKKKFLVALTLFLVNLSSYADSYDIDTTHSAVGFKVKHLGISWVPGKFTKFSGSYNFDPKNLSQGSVEATITADSIFTDETKRDAHLKDKDFLDTTAFSDIKFKSKSIKDVKADSFKVVEDLTLHGVTKEVVLDVTVGGVANDPWGNQRSAFTATTKINRKDFGLTWNKLIETGGLVVGEDVLISLEIEGIKKKS